MKLYVKWAYLLCFINAHSAFLLCTAELMYDTLYSSLDKMNWREFKYAFPEFLNLIQLVAAMNIQH